MLTRDQQRLLAAVGTSMAADALLDRLRERGTLEGGRSAPQDGCWINYNRKAVWLEDHSEFSAALSAASDAGLQGTADEQAPWRRIKPTVLVKMTWAEAAAHGASLSPALRDELATLQRTERLENRSWSEFSDQHGVGLTVDASTATRSTRSPSPSGTRHIAGTSTHYATCGTGGSRRSNERFRSRSTTNPWTSSSSWTNNQCPHGRQQAQAPPQRCRPEPSRQHPPTHEHRRHRTRASSPCRAPIRASDAEPVERAENVGAPR
jgi:hypothetical protein